MRERRAFALATAPVAAAVALAAAAAAGSAPPSLDSLPAGSGIVMAFAFDTREPGSVYAGTLGGHVYKSTDAGQHWRLTTAGSISDRVDALVADPGRPGTLYAGTGVAVYKTVNGGRSWMGFNRGLLPPPPVIAPGQVTATRGHREAEGWVDALAVDPTDSDIVYAGTGGGVKKSTNGGRSWRTVLWRGRYMGTSAVVIAPTTPRVVYATAFVSEPADCGIGGTIPCRQRELLVKTTNGGKTWRQTGFPASNPEGYPEILALEPRRPTTLYAAAGKTVLTSTDAGSSWQLITDGLPAERQVTSLVVDPRRPGTVYVGLWSRNTPKGIFRTNNGGLTWSQALARFPVTALAVDPAHPATIYAGGGDNPEPRILRSTNSGRTWVPAG
jgi:photosystem II stability/assembly factor-like uncharacterized protein